MPFASAFSVNNLGITLNNSPSSYMVTGIFSMVTGPAYREVQRSSGVSIIFLFGLTANDGGGGIYCNLGITPFWIVLVLNILMFAGVSSRIISSSALVRAVPAPQDRGAFMSVNSSVQQISGGIAAFVAGLIVVQTPEENSSTMIHLGYVVVGAMIITMIMMYSIHLYVDKNSGFK